MMQKLILQNFQSPGDIVMLTAAVRDLHHCYPGQYLSDVRTACPQLWENNPFITELDDSDPDVQLIDCEYPLIHQSNERPYHFIHAFMHFLNDTLNIHMQPTEFRGDIHLGNDEKSWMSQVEEMTGIDMPFWVINAGGKYDFTAKWWDPGRYQQVVDAFRDRILFVQVGETGHWHPSLDGVLNLVGKTDLRQLIRLIHHAHGVLTPVSLAMHLAAAVDVRVQLPINRACVVIAGGREPMQWEAYPHHQFIHTNGALRCCDHGGCWKSRVQPLGDGADADQDSEICVDVVGHLPRCLDMINAEDVIRRIELYYKGGALNYLNQQQQQRAQDAIARQYQLALEA